MKMSRMAVTVGKALPQTLPALVLAIGLLITFVCDIGQRQQSYGALNREFTVRAQDIFSRIGERLENYGQILRGGAGLFASGQTIGHDEWRKYVGSLALDQTLHGLQGLGFSRSVKAQDLVGYLGEVRREGLTEYRITPEGSREHYAPVLYFEPLSGRDRRAVGADQYSEPGRRAAMEAARDQGRITITGKVRPGQDIDADSRAGFLMYVPVYRNNAPKDSLAERQENLFGWIYAPFRMDLFMKSLIRDGFSIQNKYLDVIIFDGDKSDADSVMFHNDNDVDPVISGGRQPLLLFKRVMSFGGRFWTVVIHSPEVFDSQYFDNRAMLIEVFGGIISVLIAFISWLLISAALSRRQRDSDASGVMPLPRLTDRGQAGRVAPYALASLLSLAAGAVVMQTDDSERLVRDRQERTEVENQLDVIRLRLERTLTGPILAARGMVAEITAHGDITLPAFDKAAEVLLRGHAAIRNIGVSHGTVLDMIYPLAGNEGALGADYRAVDWQWPTVRRAIETRAPAVHGPISLIQGGSGLIVREPVFLPDAGGGENRLFGLVSVVLNIPAVYAEAGLERDDLPIAVAIRGRDGLGDKGEMIRGQAPVFAEKPVETDVIFPYGTWRLAAIPKAGWGRAEPLLPVSRLLGGGFFLFVVLISFGTAHHIIERRRLLHRVGLSEERFRLLLDLASDGIHILGEDGRLVMWSRSFLGTLGYAESEGAGLSIADWDAAIPRERLIERLAALIRVPAVFETRHRRRDGSEFDVEINAGGIEMAGKRYLYASSRDITERKIRDEELRQARRAAEEAARAKSDFLAMMSHEIRTPITSVLGMADLLYRTSLTAVQSDYLAILRSSTKTLMTILNDILDISKIEAGKIAIEATPFRLRDAVREVVELGQGTASAKGLALTLDIAPAVPAVVVGDPTRLKQVLFNLLNNAIKFTEHGSATVRLSLAEPPGPVSAASGAVIRFEVEDTGIGIDADQRDHLFTAFTQADATTTRRFGGTGLGLAISRKLVELMSGRIGVDSQSGAGATFWFVLPFGCAAGLEPAPESGPIALSPAGQGARPLKILLAEDNRINQMLVRSMLQQLGHSVRVVENGRQALDAVIAGDLDIVLMDMQMPEMDGEEATRAIRSLPGPWSGIPVLALTADVMAGHRERYLQAGVNDLVPKPIDRKVLCEALRVHTGAAVDASPAGGRA
ncbi:MAG: CHASE domain-containing protein [Rhodospirillaceae bacterium]